MIFLFYFSGFHLERRQKMAPARRDPRGAAPEALPARGGEQTEGSAAPALCCLSGREEPAVRKARKEPDPARGNRGGGLEEL